MYERVLCLLVAEEGYKIEVKLGSKKAGSLVFFKKKVSPVFKNIFNLDRDPKSLDKYLTLLGLKVKIAEGNLEYMKKICNENEW